jgi:hypothetical protein
LRFKEPTKFAHSLHNRQNNFSIIVKQTNKKWHQKPSEKRKSDNSFKIIFLTHVHAGDGDVDEALLDDVEFEGGAGLDRVDEFETRSHRDRSAYIQTGFYN